jgi:hypothetical protein
MEQLTMAMMMMLLVIESGKVLIVVFLIWNEIEWY